MYRIYQYVLILLRHVMRTRSALMIKVCRSYHGSPSFLLGNIRTLVLHYDSMSSGTIDLSLNLNLAKYYLHQVCTSNGAYVCL